MPRDEPSRRGVMRYPDGGGLTAGERARREQLTVFQLPAYAFELNPVESVWAHLKRSLANLVKHDIAQLTALAKTRLSLFRGRSGARGMSASPGRRWRVAGPVLLPLGLPRPGRPGFGTRAGGEQAGHSRRPEAGASGRGGRLSGGHPAPDANARAREHRPFHALFPV
jgi:hypothetical protein